LKAFQDNNYFSPIQNFPKFNILNPTLRHLEKASFLEFDWRNSFTSCQCHFPFALELSPNLKFK